MAAVFIAWILSAAILALVAIELGVAIRRGVFGILIDERGRYSLTHFQVSMWTIVILSLISGVFWGRLVGLGKDALGFTIPSEMLAVLGISVGSAVTSGVIKAQKDQNLAVAQSIAANDESHPPALSQLFLLEEGVEANKVIDITKFQTFFITLILIIAYVAQAIASISMTPIANLKALPGFSETFVALLAISHGGYIIGKVPNRPGTPEGITMKTLQRK